MARDKVFKRAILSAAEQGLQEYFNNQPNITIKPPEGSAIMIIRKVNNAPTEYYFLKVTGE